MPRRLRDLWENLTARRWWDRLAVKLVVLVLAVSTLPPLMLGILSMRSAHVNQEREIQDRNMEVALSGVRMVEAYIDKIVENMRLVIDIADLRSMDIPRLENPLGFFLSFLEDVKEVVLFDAEGRERLKLSEGVLYTAEDLRYLPHAAPVVAGRQGRLYIGPVETSPFQEPLVTIALPIQSFEQDRVLGILTVQVNLKRLWDDVLSFRVGQSGYLYLIDANGRLIAHPDFSLVLGKADFRSLQEVRRFLSGQEPAQVPVPPYLNHQRQPVLGTHARSSKLGWGVIVERPVAEALANIQQTKIETAFIFFSTLVVTLLLGILVARRLVRPLTELRRGARLVEEGSLEHRIPADSQDELGELAEAFNRMTGALRKSFEGLYTLLKTSRTISSSLRVEEVLHLALVEAGKVIEGVRCAIILFEPTENGNGKRSVRFIGEGTIRPLDLEPADYPHILRSLQGQATLVVADGEGGALSSAEHELWGDETIRTVLIVPLMAGERLIGALLVASLVPRTFTEAETTLFQTVANQVAIAIENARLFEEVSRSRREWEDTFDAIADCISIHDEHFTIVQVNRAMTEKFGSRPGALVGRKCHDLFFGRNEPCINCPQVRTLEREAPASEEIVDPRSATTYAIATYPVKVPGGRGVVHVARDVSLQKKMEEQLLQSEKLVAVGTLASGIAHDFNNLLTTISVRSQVLQQRAGDPEIRKSLKVIERAAWDGAETVRRLREFTRPGGEETGVVDVNEVVRKALRLTDVRWKDEAERAGIRIAVETDLGEIPPVRARSAELREILVNLILNAVDAMPRGGLLRIRTRGVPFNGAGEGVEIQVADTGLGMSPEVKGKIFNPFFTTKGVQGTGLGLTVTYGIVTRYGGHLSVESAEGRGSTFTVRLPAGGGAQTGSEEPPAVRSPRPLRVLLIDDDAEVRAAVTDLMRSIGWQVEEAGAARAGIALAMRGEYDLVVTDLGMPELSGWDVAQSIKAQRPEFPVILLTGWGDFVETDQRRKRKVDGILKKPFHLEQLLALASDLCVGAGVEPISPIASPSSSPPQSAIDNRKSQIGPTGM